MHGDGADGHRLLVGDHLPTADAGQRVHVAVEDLQTNLADARRVAQVSVEYHANAAVLHRRVPGELAEVTDEVAGVLRHEHRVGGDLLERFEIGGDAFGSLFPRHWRNDLHTFDREGDTHERPLRKQRTQRRGKHLFTHAQLIHRIGDSWHVHPAESNADLSGRQFGHDPSSPCWPR